MACASAAGSLRRHQCARPDPKISGMPPTPLAMIGIPAPPASMHDVGQRFRARRHHQQPAVREGLPRRRVAEEADAVGEAQPRHLVAQRRAFLAVAGDGEADARGPDRCSSAIASISTSVPLMWRNSPTQTISAASASGATGAISAALMPLCTTRTMPRGAPTMASIGVAGECAFEQEQFGAAAEKPLDRAIDHAAQRVAAVMQRAAVRRVDADRGARRHQPHEGAALGAVAVQHVGVERCEMARDMDEAPARSPGPSSRCMANRDDAELHLRRDGRERGLGARAAGRAVADDADVMAARRLAARRDRGCAGRCRRPACGCTCTILRRLQIGHGQNQRSETAMVSPGRSG